MKTSSEVLQEGKRRLQEAEKENYAFEASLLLAEVLKTERVQLFLQGDRILTEEEETLFFDYISQREKHRPLQYILGECEFMGLPFSVGEGVLVPRADTEVLVEQMLEVAKKENIKTIVDVGTGSGCIPISLMHYGDFQAIGLDISPKALSFAKENAKKNGVEMSFYESNLFSGLPQEKMGKIDAIVSNPPYIETAVIAELMPEVRDFEPMNALDGGLDGLDFYREIMMQAKTWLRKDGWLFFEIGYNQAAEVSQCLQENGYTQIGIKQDLAGKDRVVLGKMSEVQ